MTRRPRRPRHRAAAGSDPGPRAGRGAEANADDRDGRLLSRRVQVWVALSSALTNLVGAVIVFAFAVWVLPSDPIPEGDRVVVANAVGVAIWLPVAVAVGTFWGARTMGPARRWLLEERAPTSEEEIAVLRSPLRVFRVQLMLWFVSAVLFSVVNGFVSPRLISRVGFTVVLGGLSTSAVAYLTTERLMRPVAARALAEGDVERPRLPGVAARQLLAWALGSGVPVFGLVITGILGLAEGTASRVSLSVTMISLGAVVLSVGLWVTILGARSVADPVRSVREGLNRVQDGDLEAEIPVYDGSEMGLLQDGFNRMVAGLRERERIRDLFGRHVGAGVARDALDRDMPLGGEVRDVAVLFVDIVGSTRLAAERPPAEVVEVLNRFFSVVVETVDDHGGWINKFQGDAALAIFGAPDARADPAGSALAAARSLARRLEGEVPDCEAGIGVAAGPAVAGNIGAEERFEYTVIGDPVNAAARLSEQAKEVPGRVLASDEAVEAADTSEAARWGPGQVVTLRGRVTPTVLHHPVGAGATRPGASGVVDRSDRG